MSIELTNESGLEVDEAELADIASFAMRHLRIHPDSELSILLVNDDAMTELHVEWMDEPGPTDVMSFPMDELTSAPDGVEPEPGMLGDIVLDPHFAYRQADGAGNAHDAELRMLMVHGVLHLIGYDHAEPDQEREMFALQQKILDDWLVQRDGVVR